MPPGCQARNFIKERPVLVFENQPFIDALQTRCSWIIQKIHRKTPMLESLFKLSLEADVAQNNYS